MFIVVLKAPQVNSCTKWNRVEIFGRNIIFYPNPKPT